MGRMRFTIVSEENWRSHDRWARQAESYTGQGASCPTLAVEDETRHER